MALIQVRDVPTATVMALKAKAGERGVSLSAYLRDELGRLATQPSNALIVEQIANRSRQGGPSVDETVAELRSIRRSS